MTINYYPTDFYTYTNATFAPYKIEEIDGQYHIEAYLTGIKKEDVSIKYEQPNNITIRTKDRDDIEIYLPRTIDSDKSEATLDLGVLKIQAPFLFTDKTIQIK